MRTVILLMHTTTGWAAVTTAGQGIFLPAVLLSSLNLVGLES